MNRPDLNTLSKEVFEAKGLVSMTDILLWLIQNNIPVLHLNLTTQWYDMIESGIKKEEYRAIKPFYNRMFCDNGTIKIKSKYYHPTDVIVCFSNGYAKDRRQMFWTLKTMRVSFGNPEWGASKIDQYYTLYLNEKIVQPHTPDETWKELLRNR